MDSLQRWRGSDDTIRVASLTVDGDVNKSNYPVEFPSGGP
jgi:hypothetical protein